MIKVKIVNPIKGRNEPTFRSFHFFKDILHSECSIDISSDSDSYDYLFIGMADFHDMQLSLKDSAEWGLENIDKISEGGEYFLFDGFDSTSLLGSYEVFDKSNAIYLFKNQLLKNRDDYKNTYGYGKWWFETGSELDISYDIPKDKWDRIKLSGYNLGYLLPQYHNYQSLCDNKIHDICAIYKAEHDPVPFNQAIAPGIDYTKHRKGAWDILEKYRDKYSIFLDRLPYQEYVEKLWKSKIALSPFGMGEVCFRDFELMQFGTLMIKPDMDIVNTYPNPYIKDETYISVKPDWSDLEEKIEKVLGNFQEYSYIVNNFRNNFTENYTKEKFCMYWYNIFSNLNGVIGDSE